MTPRRPACWHEAGHIAAFRGLLDARVKYVAFFPRGGARTRLLVPVSRDGDLWGRVLCLLAGPAAEARFVGGRYAGQCESDFDRAERVIARLDLALDEAWPHALDLVDRQRRPIARLACHLVHYGIVDEAALSALL